MGANKYLYAVSRIEALENTLLDKGLIERMIEGNTPDDVLRVLSESVYAEPISEIKNFTEYEHILSHEQRATNALLKEICPEKQVVDIFSMKYDVHNLKVLLKAYFLEENRDELLVDTGTISIKAMKMAIHEKNYTDIEEPIAMLIESIFEENLEKVSPKAIDERLDCYLYEEMYRKIVGLKSSILTEYIQSQIDLINIKSFARVKGIGLSKNDFKRTFIAYGKHELDFYLKFFEDTLEAFLDAFQYSDYKTVVEEGIGRYLTSNRLTRYEKLADNYVFDIIKRSKYVAFGVEPIVGFLMAKENELKIIRMLMVGKINSIPNEIIRERLREVYV